MKKLMEKDKSCIGVLLFGIIIGIISGIILGVSISTLKYSEIITSGYLEIITDDNNTLFANRNGKLYQLIQVNRADDLSKKVDNVIDALRQHDDKIEIKDSSTLPTAQIVPDHNHKTMTN